MTANNEERIRLIASDARVRVTAGEQLIADTHAAIELHEQGHPMRLYIPRGDVDVSPAVLHPSDKQTHCPYKGDATYFNLQQGGITLANAAWCYPAPIDSMAAIANHLAFDHPQIALQIE